MIGILGNGRAYSWESVVYGGMGYITAWALRARITFMIYVDYDCGPYNQTLHARTHTFPLLNLRPRTRLPHQKRLMLNPIPTIRSHIKDHLVHLLPSVPQILR